MRLNAASCVLFGGLFIAAPQAVATFLGQAPQAVITGLGIGLLANASHLVVASGRREIRKSEVIWFSLGDFGWWLATLALIVAGFWITTSWGVFSALCVATCVAGLGVSQLWILGLQMHGHSGKAHLVAMARSWMALPLWVKIWLLFLNGVFLAAIAFLPDRVAEVTLIAYVATAPLLAGQVAYDAGFRRLLGVAHLVPWLPLLAWLVITFDGSSYRTLLTVTVAICLAFDINDLWLFVKGDRAVMGAPALKVTNKA